MHWRDEKYKILVGKPEGKIPVGWEDNIRLDLRDVEWRSVD
jgi:hypothetical protein